MTKTSSNHRQDERQMAYQPYPRHNNNNNYHHHHNHRNDRQSEQLQLCNIRLHDDNICLRRTIDELHQNTHRLRLQNDRLTQRHSDLQHDLRQLQNDCNNLQRLHEDATKKLLELQDELAEQKIIKQEDDASVTTAEQSMMEEEDTASAATTEQQISAWHKFSRLGELSPQLHNQYRNQYIGTLDKNTQKAIKVAIEQLTTQRLTEYNARYRGTNTAKYMASFNLWNGVKGVKFPVEELRRLVLQNMNRS